MNATKKNPAKSAAQKPASPTAQAASGDADEDPPVEPARQIQRGAGNQSPKANHGT